MERDEDVSIPLEDEDGYIQCRNYNPNSDYYRKSDSNLARKLSPSPPPPVFIVGARRPQREEDFGESEQWSMGSRKRSKSLERLSAASIRPSPPRGGNVACSSSAGFSTTGRRRRQPLEAPSPRAQPPVPRIPPRPTEQVLNRFQQQRANLSIPPAAAAPSWRSPPPPATPPPQLSAGASRSPQPKRRYVEVDLGKGGGKTGRAATGSPQGSPRLAKSRAAQQPRTSYVVLQLGDGGNGVAASPSGVVRREHAGGKTPVKRCKSNVTERSIAVQQQSDRQPRFSAAYHHPPHPSAALVHHHQQQQETPGVSSPSSRKPRKSSTPNPQSHTGPRQHLPPRTTSLTGVSSLEQNQFSDLVRLEEPVEGEDSGSTSTSLHIIDLRSGTTAYRGDGPQIQRPPPPVRIPPSRPPAPVPRPRKNLQGKPQPTTTAKTNNPAAELEPYVQMSPVLSSTNCSQVPNSGTSNLTPLPRQSWGQQRWRGGGEGGGDRERQPTPDSDSEEFGAYSYVDLVKNRHLLGHGGPTATDEATAHPPSHTGEYIIILLPYLKVHTWSVSYLTNQTSAVGHPHKIGRSQIKG